MTKLPQGDRAILESRKLADYCLSLEHPRGRHKARVFRDALGIARSDASWLRNELLAGILEAEAVPMESDTYGTRWRVDVLVVRQARNVVVRTLWIIKRGENVPRFVTCWVM